MKITWKGRKGELKAVSVREAHSTKDGKEYAVLTVVASRRGGKNITMMCFIPAIYNVLSLNDTYSYSGFVSFGYGNTFLVVEEVRDFLGYDVLSENSICQAGRKEIRDKYTQDMSETLKKLGKFEGPCTKLA